MNKTDMMAATGNCMTVSVVGAALGAVFRHLSQAAHCSPWLSLPLDLSAGWRRSESLIFCFRKALRFKKRTLLSGLNSHPSY